METLNLMKLVLGLKRPEASTVILPSGRYTVDVNDIRVLDHKNGDGKSVNVSYRINNGGEKFHGAYVNSFHIVEHSNEQAVEIGMEELARIAIAVGRDLSDEETNVDVGSFIGKSLEVRLGDPEEGRNSNPVTGFYAS